MRGVVMYAPGDVRVEARPEPRPVRARPSLSWAMARSDCSV